MLSSGSVFAWSDLIFSASDLIFGRILPVLGWILPVFVGFTCFLPVLDLFCLFYLFYPTRFPENRKDSGPEKNADPLEKMTSLHIIQKVHRKSFKDGTSKCWISPSNPKTMRRRAAYEGLSTVILCYIK